MFVTQRTCEFPAEAELMPWLLASASALQTSVLFLIYLVSFFRIFVLFVGDFTGQSGPRHRDGTVQRSAAMLPHVPKHMDPGMCPKGRNMFDKLHSDVCCSTVGHESSVTESTIEGLIKQKHTQIKVIHWLVDEKAGMRRSQGT